MSQNIICPNLFRSYVYSLSAFWDISFSVCAVSMSLMRVMQWITEQAGSSIENERNEGWSLMK